MNIFFWWENGLHRRFHPQTGGDEHTSPTVYEPVVMSPPITAGFETGSDDPSYHQRLKSNAPQTGGDAHFEPAVMGGAGEVNNKLPNISKFTKSSRGPLVGPH